MAFVSTDVIPAGQNPVYTWNIGGNASSASSTSRVFSTVGERQASLTVSYASGCSNTTIQNFVVKPTPVANFTNNLVCSGQEVSFKNTTNWTDGQIGYAWDFGDGNLSQSTHANHVYNVSSDGNVNVKLTASIVNGCSNEISKTVPVNVSPTRCDFTVNQDDANGIRNFTFSPTDGTNTGGESGVTYTWFYGNGDNSTGSTGEVNFARDGNYMVSMRATRPSGCMCESSQEVSVARSNTNQFAAPIRFEVYPSPNNGVFSVNVAGTSIGKIEVTDVIGNKLLSTSVEALSNGGNTIDIRGVSSGIYFVRFKNAEMQQVAKIQVIE
jgi:hypothetical protein